VIIANSFAAGRAGLEPAGLGGRVAEANVNAGCCGTGPGHIQALASHLPRHCTPPGQPT
jgi:hypothetical protein